ncbi:MAG: aquaporin [Candidatus Sulfotelmatobacter sp.]
MLQLFDDGEIGIEHVQGLLRKVAYIQTGAVPFAVASYITAAYWFTGSTSFANPAVTIARCLSGTFAGIQPADVPLFVVAQLTGALTATFLLRWLIPNLPAHAAEVLVSH